MFLHRSRPAPPSTAMFNSIIFAMDQPGLKRRWTDLLTLRRADRQVVIAAVKICGLSLQHASVRLRAKRKVVLLAVKQAPKSLPGITQSSSRRHPVRPQNIHRGYYQAPNVQIVYREEEEEDAGDSHTRITFKSNDRFGGFEAVIEQPEEESEQPQRVLLSST